MILSIELVNILYLIANKNDSISVIGRNTLNIDKDSYFEHIVKPVKELLIQF